VVVAMVVALVCVVINKCGEGHHVLEHLAGAHGRAVAALLALMARLKYKYANVRMNEQTSKRMN
jgi:hypothetical protein